MYLSSHFLANLGLSDVLKTADLAGIPLPWPQATPPAGWLKCNGQAFDKNAFPKLALAYPGGVLPDLRGEFIRGWDDGRGVDAGRLLVSNQLPTMLRTAILDYVGNDTHNIAAQAIGVAFDQADFATKSQSVTAKAPNNEPIPGGDPDSGIPGTVSTTAVALTTGTSWWISTRPRNIAFSYIVRAA
ncbi:phage tail protein [Dickeya fangzhongdai]|uniref:phage tail protein n=1 Tax=Dickeya fangzhongdai TaxID=1778540 RepID=UPI003307980F